MRGLLALNLAVAAADAMVIVNTVVLVRGTLGLGDAYLAWTLAAYGFGSMIAALSVPRLLERIADRAVMLAGAALLAGAMAFGPAAAAAWITLLPLWALLGFGNGLVLTPTGRLLRQSAEAGDRPALFAAQFALSHACWLLTYPLAGRLGAIAGTDLTFLVLAVLAALGAGLTWSLWPAGGVARREHVHLDLPADHPHLAGAEPLPSGGFRHTHPQLADGLHRSVSAGHPEADCSLARGIPTARISDIDGWPCRLEALRVHAYEHAENCRSGAAGDCRVIETLADFTHGRCRDSRHGRRPGDG